MKEVLKSFGFLLLFILIVSILLYIIIDETKPQWNDVGFLEIAVLIIGASLSPDILISLIILALLSFLKFKNILALRYNIILFFSYILTVLITVYLRYSFSLEFHFLSPRQIIWCLIIPVVHIVINYSILRIIFKKKIETFNN